MNMQKIVAVFYIAIGIAMIIVFGGKLLLQLLGILAGLYMIWQGVSLQRSMFFNANFKNFSDDRFKER